jgi:hypothetical protein
MFFKGECVLQDVEKKLCRFTYYMSVVHGIELKSSKSIQTTYESYK